MKFHLCLFAACLLTASCGTPPAVKELSAAQVNYLETATTVVASQSEALLKAAAIIRDQAKATIAANNAASQKNFAEELLKSTNQKPTVADIEKLLQVQSTLDTANAASLALMDQQYQQLEAKTKQLGTYMEKLKEVQQTLNSYLVSEQAGESFVNSILDNGTVANLLAGARTLAGKVTNAASDVNSILDQLNTSGKTGTSK